MPTVIAVRDIVKRYGSVVAVDRASFAVERGEIFGLLGPNGAGKTTTLECVEGLKRPDGGRIEVFGLDAWRDRVTIRPRIGVQLQESRLQARIKVREALDLFASFYQAPLDWRSLLAPLDLEDKRDAVFGDLSGGQKQRLFVGLAMVGDGELLFLDELTTGLDPHARHAMWDLVRSVRDRGRTIVLTTHFMEEAERLCDRVGIMNGGRLIAVDSPAGLVDNHVSGSRVSFVVDGSLTPTALDTIPGVSRVDESGGRVVVHGAGDGLVTGVARALEAMGGPYHDLRSERASLEDVFLELTGHAFRD